MPPDSPDFKNTPVVNFDPYKWILSQLFAWFNYGQAGLLNKNHIYESKFPNGVFLKSGGSGGFAFSISAKSDNFEI